MPTDVSIAMSVKDNLSQAVVVMKNSMTDFRDDVTKLEQELKRLNDIQAGTKTRISEATDEVRAAKKAYKDLGDSVSEAQRQAARADWEKAEANLRSLRQEYNLVERQVRSTTREFENMSGVASRAQNRAGGSGAGGIMAQLGQAGAWQMLGQTAGQWANALAGSALGSAGGNLFSGALSGAGSGAAIGSMIAPGIGTAIGAALGGAVGMLGGAAQNFESKDAAFKDYYGGLYEAVAQGTADMLSSGSAIAGSREQTQMAFAQRFGSDEAAAAYLSRVQSMATKTNYSYDEITGYSKLLLNSYDPESVFGILGTLSDASAGLNLNTSDIQMFISGLSRMRTLGKATNEYLNYFSERGVDVYAALGQSLGVDKSQISAMVTKGQIGGAEAAQAILDYIDQEFGGLSEKLAGTYDAMVDNLQDTMANLEAMGGTGYNSTRISGIQAQQDAYGGILGDAVGEINRIAGENKAYLENLSERYTREALSAVLLGQEATMFSNEDKLKLDEMREAFVLNSAAYEQGNQEAGMKMEALKEQAEALATAAYQSSEQYLSLNNVEIDQISAIRDNTAALESWRSNYEKTLEFTKGYSASSSNREQLLSGMPAQWQGALHGQSPYGTSSNAYGLSRVPYDNYAAILHQGERVLTARQAREMDSGRASGPISVTVTGQWSVRGESDLDAIGLAIANALERKLAAGAR